MIVAAFVVVILIFAFMVFAALTWAKHGMSPTQPSWFWVMPDRMRRASERSNRQFGWGDGVDDDDVDSANQKPPTDT